VPFPAKTNTDAILASATDILKTGGISSLSMRTLAARLGVRASSLYRHFPDRSSIEKTMAVHAEDQLLERMRQTVDGLRGEPALLAAARAYLDYATSESAFYDLIMQSIGSAPRASAAANQISDFLLRLLSDATQLGDDPAGAAALWSFLHGFTVLLRAGQISEAASKLAFARGTQSLLRGLSVAAAEAAGSPS
jgi:AcrR family transcriptional regulator